jgi:hypothetical protein
VNGNVLEIKEGDALFLIGNGLFSLFSAERLEGVKFYEGVGSPTNFAEAFRRPPTSPIQSPAIRRP